MAEHISSEDEFKDALSQELVVIDFSANWCGPCRTIAPFFNSLPLKYTNVKFYKIDVDELPDVVQSSDITGMPTFISYKNGEEVDRVVGANKAMLEDIVRYLTK